MNRIIAGSLLSFVIALPVQAEDKGPVFQNPAAYDRLGKSHHTLSIQYADFTLKDENQPVLLNSNFVFDDSVDTAFGIEYLYHFNDFHAIGAQYFYTKYDYVSTFASEPGELDVSNAMFTYKGYLRPTEWFRPFVNAAIGVAYGEASTENNSMVGLTYGAGVGFYFPFSSRIGVTLEYKYIGGELNNADDNKIDISSDAVTGALNIIF